MTRLARIVLVATICLAAAGVAVAIALRPRQTGDELPVLEAAPDFELVNQAGQSVRLSGFEDKVKVLCFMYVRCHIVTQCPLTTKNLKALQEMLNAGVRDRVRFLSLSFDPESDSPAALKKYGELYGADFGNWDFLTGDKTEVDRVCDTYQIIHEKQDDGSPVIRHSVITFLIDEENNVRRMYFANAWKPEDVVRDVLALLGIGESDEEWKAIQTAIQHRANPDGGSCCPGRG